MDVLNLYSALETISGRIAPALSDGQMLYLRGTGLIELLSVPQLQELERKSLGFEALRDGFERSLIDLRATQDWIDDLEKRFSSSWHRLWSRKSTLEAELRHIAGMKSKYDALREKADCLLNETYDVFAAQRKVSHSASYDGQHIVLTDDAFLLLSITNVHIVQKKQISSYEALRQEGELVIGLRDFNTALVSSLGISSAAMHGIILVDNDSVRQFRKQQLSEVIEGLKGLQYAVLYKPAYLCTSTRALS